jgi:hypothetical protein
MDNITFKQAKEYLESRNSIPLLPISDNEVEKYMEYMNRCD